MGRRAWGARVIGVDALLTRYVQARGPDDRIVGLGEAWSEAIADGCVGVWGWSGAWTLVVRCALLRSSPAEGGEIVGRTRVT